MKKIDKGNIAIHEFLGEGWYAYSGNSAYNEVFPTYKDCAAAIRKNKWKGYHPDVGFQRGTGKYHEDWNWLMQAVERIENLDTWPIPKQVIIKGNSCRIVGGVMGHPTFRAKTKLKAVWLAVVDFANYYKMV